ncbi:Protein of unknown function [Lactobacillus delbrueckii subsp. bulgaricus]|nr:Protein of unknown function [Lactobacillus delbrueckii subsp. bulgaricus]
MPADDNRPPPVNQAAPPAPGPGQGG